jgi:hypothetical protein
MIGLEPHGNSEARLRQSSAMHRKSREGLSNGIDLSRKAAE